MRGEPKAVKRLFTRLRRASRHHFPEQGGKLECPRRHGVYLIFDPRGRIAHVGRTTRAQNGLRQRLQAHLAGRSSFVQQHLNGRQARLRKGYKYAWLEVPNPRLRALVEAYATGVLCPQHVGTGEAAS
jgi:hypothetical protein